MAISPPASLDEDDAHKVFMVPPSTVRAAAHSRGISMREMYGRLEPWIHGLAVSLRSSLARSGWPESDEARRKIVIDAVSAALGPLAKENATLITMAAAQKGRPVAWLYEADAGVFLRGLYPPYFLDGVNLVALSILVRARIGGDSDPIDHIVRHISRPHLIRSQEGESDPAASSGSGPVAPLYRLPGPMTPFSGKRGDYWPGAAPPPAAERDASTLPRVNAWENVEVAPPISGGGSAGGAIAVILASIAVASLFR